MFEIIAHSQQSYQDGLYFIAQDSITKEKVLGIRAATGGFTGSWDENLQAFLCPRSAENAQALRARLPWLKPVPLGLRTSFGFGDRLGYATPGHVCAVQHSAIAPIFAQQSVRENTRTGRSPQQVLDDAMWGVFEMAWQSPWGADADHIKTLDALPAFIQAGYSFYTIDPGDQVDNAAQNDPLEILTSKVAALPWERMQISPQDWQERYQERTFTLPGFAIKLDAPTLWRAAAKYQRAILHALEIACYIKDALNGAAFDLEMSVDETLTPTSVEEHFYIASELRRLGVPFISLAPRFIGSFEKGVDYIGDVERFEASFIQHAAVMRHFGGYKISIHTGSDKFSIYPIVARHTAGLAHVKTAGTSFLEALRLVAIVQPDLFTEIYGLSRARYETDRATYHVSGQLERAPLGDGDRLALFDQFDARQVMHVTFGSVMDLYGAQILDILVQHADLYAQLLKKHFDRHLAPFLSETLSKEQA